MRLALFLTILINITAADNQPGRTAYQEGNPQFDVRIIEPERDDVEAEKEIDVKGTARIPSGNHLWVLLHRIKNFEKVWWPQNEAQIDPITEKWQTHIYLGVDLDAGSDFAIAAITVDENEHLKLLQYRKDAVAKDDWRPIKMPPTTSPAIYRRVKRSGAVFNGRAIIIPKPDCSEDARLQRFSGTVVVQIWLDEKGRVTKAHAVSGNSELYAAAEAAASQARFTPTLVSGKPVKVSGLLSYSFHCQ